jgi:hypothetical protein
LRRSPDETEEAAHDRATMDPARGDARDRPGGECVRHPVDADTDHDR